MVYWEEGKKGVIYKGRFCPVWSGLYLFESDLHHRGALEDISRTLKAGKNDAAVVVEVEDNKTYIPVDDYNGVVAPEGKRDVIGAIVPNFSRMARKNGWKIIEVYEDDEGASGEVL